MAAPFAASNDRVIAFVGLGANQGNPEDQLIEAIARISKLPNTTPKAISPAYWTRAWGVSSPQPDYLNAVVAVETQLPAHEFLLALQVIEKDLGRVRGVERYGPRTLDLDLLVFGALVMDEEQLTIPHPRLHQRGFVLLPLADIAPDLEIPNLDRVDRLLESLEEGELDDIRPAHIALYPKT